MTKTKVKINWTIRDYPKIRGHLEEQIRNGRISHAYLFFGPGRKNSLAKDFAKILLCEGNKKPCNKGACCRLFDLGHHQDFILLKKQEGDSKIKISSVRELISRASLKTFHRRVILIKNAQYLSDGAANALLKIIEESPKDTIFILTASDKTALPATISSRCQAFYIYPDKNNLKLSKHRDKIKKYLQAEIIGRFEMAQEIAKDRAKADIFLKNLEKERYLEIKKNKIPPKKLLEEIKLINQGRGLLKSNVSARLILENLSLKLRRIER